ncbi:heat shock 70 kDa protein 16-like [Vicia villosa]|uniref:heat shock 70 kDa protein 16-like n=1 Tax=Vicia villosa TaxID=3911 RepID=UPI00273AF8E8|nr:heat shock 70 kDa protein 16-like [Vicia villosa]XP_058745065.1 heat shock 70 kDa protein 16-like [Vicia villosa]
MSVIGFDIGNENCVIAVVKQGGVDVLLNDESNRETPAVVCFGEKQRFLGSAGAASAMMHPKSTVSQVKRLIGRRFDDPEVQNDLKLLPVETSEGPDGGILIHLKYLKETHKFRPVQILAMLFANLKTIAEHDLGSAVSDCVIGVPSYFTDLQRRAYLDAATIVGLKPVRLIHDCTATGLGYGVYKTDFPDGGPIYVVFIDIGHCDTQVSIASFQAGKMKMLSHAFDTSLGGRDFDEVLFRHFAEKFKEQYKIDVYSNARACTRLRAACEKLKKVLSANLEAPLNIECLMDEKDVSGFIKREEFESLASGLLERIYVPCNEALASAGLTVDKIYSVELVGSGSRIPAITKLLTSLFKKELSRTLNASECVARGCALQCAMLSPIFRVKEYEVQDSIPFSIGISSDEGLICAKPNSVLFPKGQPIPSSKTLTFQGINLVRLEAFYANPDEVPKGISPKIGCFTIDPFHGSSGSKAEIEVRMQLNLHGIVNIESSTFIEDHVEASVTPRDYHSNPEAMDVEPVSQTGQNVNEHKKCESPHSSSDGTKKDKANKRVHVPVSESIYGGLTHAEIMEAQEKEHQLTEQDKTMELTKDKRNSLESYVYDMRNKLFNVYRNFSNEQERDDISRSLQETEEWLYNEGDDETVNAYSAKLVDLKQLVDPIESRCKDEEERAQATRDLLGCIVEHRLSADSLPPLSKELIINECNKAEQWLREKMQQQDALPKSSDPVFWSSDINNKTQELNLVCHQILRSPFPEDKEEEEKENMQNIS